VTVPFVLPTPTFMLTVLPCPLTNGTVIDMDAGSASPIKIVAWMVGYVTVAVPDVYTLLVTAGERMTVMRLVNS